MKTELDLIEANNEPLCITTVRKGEPQQMVIISKAKYDELNTVFMCSLQQASDAFGDSIDQLKIKSESVTTVKNGVKIITPRFTELKGE